MQGLNELLERYLRAGDPAAMDEIVARTRGRLLATARRIGNPQDAEDSVQATYYALLQRGAKPLEAPLIAWLMTVVVRTAYRRKAINRREVELAGRLSHASDEPGPLRAAAVAESHAELRAAVARLPHTYRDVIVLRYLEDLSCRDCARMLDCTENAVRVRLSRGRDLLRSRLHPRLAYALFAFPWLLGDAARAATGSHAALGVVMKTKAVVVITLVALMALLLVGREVWSGGRESNSGRTEARGADPLSPLPDGRASDRLERSASGGAAIPAVDFDHVDRDRDVHGTVVARDGTPVAGAELTLVRNPWLRCGTLNIEGGARETKGPTTRSATDGTFRMPWTPGRIGSLDVVAAGLARRRVPKVQAGERLRIVMDEGATIVVLATDPDGLALAGVELRLFPNSGRAYAREHLGITGSDGRCVLSGVPGLIEASLEARHPVHGSPGWSQVRVPVAGTEVEHEIRMVASRVLRGRVTDVDSDEPIQGALVGMRWTQNGAVKTDENGEYVLPGWTGRGARFVHVSHADYGHDSARIGSGSRQDFRLRRGDRVVGRVVDGSGRPVASVMVSAISSYHERLRQVTSRGYDETGPDGRFRIGGLRHEMHHTLVLVADGYGRQLIDLDPASDPGGTKDLGDVAVAGGWTISGRVLEGDDRVMPRTPVSLVGANADRARREPARTKQNLGYGEYQSRFTDDLGRFRFPDLAPGSYRLTALRLSGGAVRREVVIKDGADVRGIELRFTVTREFVVSVEDSAGGPVRGAHVEVEHAGGTAQAATDSLGNATLRVRGDVSLVEYRFASHPPTGIVYRRPEPLVHLGAEASAARFVLERAGQVRGVVRGGRGKLVESALLAIVRNGEEFARCFSGDGGKFIATVPLRGSVDLVYRGTSNRAGVISLAGQEGALRAVSAGSEGLELRLQPVDRGCRIVVHVVDPDGNPLAGVFVTALPAPPDHRPLATNAGGRVTLTDLFGQKTRVHVRSDARITREWLRPKIEELVPAGQEIEARFRRGVAIVGRVANVDIATGATRVTVHRNKRFVASTMCDEQGGFRLVISEADAVGPLEFLAAEGRGAPVHRVGRLVGVVPGSAPILIVLDEQK